MEDTNFSKMAIKLQAIRKISDYKYDALNKKLLGISDSVELDTESDIKGKVNLKQASKYTGLCYGTFYYRFREDKLRHICLVKKPIFDMKDLSEYILSHRAGDWSKLSYSDEELIYGEKINLKDCCKLSGLCYNTFYSFFQRNNLPHFKYGQKSIFLKKYITELINTNFITD